MSNDICIPIRDVSKLLMHLDRWQNDIVNAMRPSAPVIASDIQDWIEYFGKLQDEAHRSPLAHKHGKISPLTRSDWLVWAKCGECGEVVGWWCDSGPERVCVYEGMMDETGVRLCKYCQLPESRPVAQPYPE